MISETVLNTIREIIPIEQIHLQESMQEHISFRVGGPADCLLEVYHQDQLQKLQKYFRMVELPFFILGNGSNLLVGDKGVRGVILKLGGCMNEIRVEGNRVIAQAGALLSDIARVACEHGLTGMEFASGIPGSIGGAVVMNAGAYGGEMKDVVKSVTVLDKNSELMELDCETMEFGYRKSAIKNQPFIATQVVLELEPGNREEIQKTIEDLTNRRNEKQPLEYPSAGSTFKRPEGYFAGELIMKSGMRGYQLGGARVSDKHCGFIINTGDACAADVVDLIQEVQLAVKERFNVDLEPEVVMIGDF